MLFRRNRTIIIEKLRQSLLSVLPVACIVFLLCFTIVPVPNGVLMAFVIGTIMLVAGIALFTLGAELAMTPMGEHIGSAVIRTRKLWFVLIATFVFGIIITFSDPNLEVLTNSVSNIPPQYLNLSVTLGAGIFLVISMLRIFFKVPLKVLLFVSYAVIFIIAQFVSPDYFVVAFISGGVATGPMTAPFIMAFGTGVASARSDKDAEQDSFGLLAIASIGPIFAVLILGLIYRTECGVTSSYTYIDINNSRELWLLFLRRLPGQLKSVMLALAPMVGVFGLFHVFKLKLSKRELTKISVGLVYTYIGLVLYLTGANVGFMPVGTYLGELLGRLEYNEIIIPVGMLIGYYIVFVKPAVHILNKQVVQITAGAIPLKAMRISLSIGVACSVGLSMVQILTDLPLMYFLIPGYVLALVLSFFTPRMFTAIAFDSGGVANGTMTSTFLWPLAVGLKTAVGGGFVTDGFGVAAMVAMTPLITIQLLGIAYKNKTNKIKNASQEVPDDAN